MFLAAVGPGLMVMLADTDAGSVVTAAQSGASWGYSLLPLEVALIPVLYLVMELTVRLGIATGQGHAELVKDCFGQKWASLSVALLLVSTTGALVTELAGLAGVGLMEGIPPRGDGPRRRHLPGPGGDVGELPAGRADRAGTGPVRAGVPVRRSPRPSRACTPPPPASAPWGRWAGEATCPSWPPT